MTGKLAAAGHQSFQHSLELLISTCVCWDVRYGMPPISMVVRGAGPVYIVFSGATGVRGHGKEPCAWEHRAVIRGTAATGPVQPPPEREREREKNNVGILRTICKVLARTALRASWCQNAR